jgi:hypothetical protein
MCQKCVKHVKKYFPKLTESEHYDLLMSATAFPFGTPKQIRKQLRELRTKTDGSLEQATAFADNRLTVAMENRVS